MASALGERLRSPRPQPHHGGSSFARVVGYSSRVTVPSDEFETMLARVRRFRKRVDELGMSGTEVDANVRARLRSRPADPLPPGQQALADEIHGFLEDSRLSAHQAAWLERTFFAGE